MVLTDFNAFPHERQQNFLDETMKASADGTKVTLYGISEKENLFGEFKELIFEKAKKTTSKLKLVMKE